MHAPQDVLQRNANKYFFITNTFVKKQYLELVKNMRRDFAGLGLDSALDKFEQSILETPSPAVLELRDAILQKKEELKRLNL